VQVRRLFAGSNGAGCFHSFFEYVIPEDARRVYLLKGGPGTGKSSLMKSLAASFEAEGLALELFFCSSDAHSLDAVSCPELGVAVIDATFPHVQDPKWPGCRDELVSLGDFWDSEQLAQRREEITAAGEAKAAHFAAAFRYFTAALAVEENRAARSRGARLDCTQAVEGILNEIKQAAKPTAVPHRARHLFASALTPQGYVSEIELLSTGLRRPILTGPSGCGQAEYLELILSHAELAGLKAEAFHDPLDPKKLLHLLLPELDLAVLTETEREPALEGERIYCGRPEESAAEAADRRLSRELLELGITELKQAQSCHAVVEGLYTAAMDFGAVEELRKRLEVEILSYRNRS
jgi:hypothetical protein